MTDAMTIDKLNAALHDAATRGVGLKLSPEEVAALAALFDEMLLSDPVNFTGEGRTLGEISEVGGFGVWADRDDIEDGALYAEQLRRRAERRE